MQGLKVRTISFAILLSLAISTEAKPWRGIVPLKSTRVDVERILGKENSLGRYQFENERAYIFYQTEQCQDGYQAFLRKTCGCGIAGVTVISIHVTPEFRIQFSTLKINRKKYKRESIQPGMYSYANLEEGVVYDVDESSDTIVGIEYLPTDADCSKRE